MKSLCQPEERFKVEMLLLKYLELNVFLSMIQIQYHKDFEAQKGHYTAVADDPETKRAQQSSRIASQVAYTQHSSGQSRLGIQQRSEAGRH